MIARLRGRSTFSRLVREGRRARAGVLWCTFVLDPSESQRRVGYAINRSIGTAVERNRLRRRLRVLVASKAQRLAPGRYLVGAAHGAGQRTFTELQFDVDRLIQRISEATSPPRSGA